MAANSFDLNLLPIAFALYDELSVSRAARLLGMCQPAVSMALRRMRETFDDPLFIRVPGGIAPTPHAHAIIEAARAPIARLQQDLLKGQPFDPLISTRAFTLALSDVGEMARDFAGMSPQLAVAQPPFELPGFDLKLHWHRRFDTEPRNRWFRDVLSELFKDDRGRLRRRNAPVARRLAGAL